MRLTEDRSLSHALQGQMIETLGQPEVRELPTGHLPMLSRPAELARLVEEFAGKAC